MRKSNRFGSLLPTILIVAGCAGEQQGDARRQTDAKPQIVLPGTARAVDFPGARTTVLLEGRATEGDIAVMEFVVAPRSFGAPPHVHRDEDEYFYVLEGEARFLNDSQTVVAPAGTLAAMTRGHVHAFWNASDRPVRLLMAVTPGQFASFFDEVVRELRASRSLDPVTVGQTMDRIARTYNIVTYPDRVPEEAKAFLPR